MSGGMLAELASHQKILIYGFGAEGKSTFSFLKKNLPEIQIGVFDSHQNLKPQLPEGVQDHTGQEVMSFLDEYDLVFMSPGVSIYKEQNKEKLLAKAVSQTSLFLKYYSHKTIGVTGSKGKSTTVSLLERVLNEAGVSNMVIGNLGLPAFEALDKPVQYYIYELSSYQLSLVRHSPAVAFLLNIHQEHLDYHLSYEQYLDDKFNISRYQQDKDVSFYNDRYPDLVKKYEQAPGKAIAVYREVGPEISAEVDRLAAAYRGVHPEVLAMLGVFMRHQKMEFAFLERALKGFRGLPCRIEFIAEIDGINYYDDSIATIPAATLHAIESLGRVDVLVCGGFDRGIDYSGFCKELLQGLVRRVVFTGSAGKRMYEKALELSPQETKERFVLKGDFETAVRAAKESALPGGNFLLSPAAPSYDEFANYRERSDFFRKLIHEPVEG